MATGRDIVVMTRAGGFIGRAAAKRLSEHYDVVGLDLHPCEDPALAASVGVNLASDESVAEALEQVRAQFGTRVASVIHLAAYFDLTGEPNPKYQEITVNGTRRLLSGLAASVSVAIFELWCWPTSQQFPRKCREGAEARKFE